MVRTYILFFPPHINANIYMSLLRVVHILLCPFLTYKKCCRIFYFFLALVASGTAQPPKVERATATCTMMEPTASAPGSLVVLKPCSSCKQQLQPKDMTSTQKADECKGTTDQWRCKPCGQVVSRISRRGYDKEQKKTIADFSPTSRVKFMKESQSLFGPDLDKKVHEPMLGECGLCKSPMAEMPGMTKLIAATVISRSKLSRHLMRTTTTPHSVSALPLFSAGGTRLTIGGALLRSEKTILRDISCQCNHSWRVGMLGCRYAMERETGWPFCIHCVPGRPCCCPCEGCDPDSE